jgi:hypothetical protein
MKIVHSILAAAFLFAWAVLLASRMLAAAVYSTRSGGSYEMGIERIGSVPPFAAWACLVIALVLVVRTLSTGTEEGRAVVPAAREDR